MNYKHKKIFIDLNEFQNLIINYSISDDFEKMFQNTTFFNKSNSEEFFQAMQHGLIWAGILAGGASNIKYYYLNTLENENEYYESRK